MNMVNRIKLILRELKEIKEDLRYLKDQVIDVDLIVTDDDIASIREAEKDLKKGRTKKIYSA